jgi:hypothetical protein
VRPLLEVIIAAHMKSLPIMIKETVPVVGTPLGQDLKIINIKD